MNFKRLETFVWVATLGNFRKAAEQMFTTQPSISLRISALEDELGVKLFERGAGPLLLTAKGTELLPYAEKIIFMTEELRKHTEKGALTSGVLRLGLTETVVHTWLPVFLRSLHHKMPYLDIEINVDNSGNLQRGLMEHSLDLVFLLGSISEPGIVNQDLCDFPLAWVASPKLQLPSRKLDLEELVKWPIITYAKTTKPFAELSLKFRELDGLPPRFFTSTSLSACRQMTLDGLGVSTLPSAMIANELKSGDLVLIEASWTPQEMTYSVSYSSATFSSMTEKVSNLAVKVAHSYFEASP